MTRIAKLHARFAAGQSLTFAEFQRLVEAFGFRRFRTSGSHLIYGHNDVADQLSIQPQGKDAKAYQMRQFAAIIRRHGLSLDIDE